MKFTFDRDSMIKEIAIAQEIITNKSPVTMLSNILVIAENNALTIKATDNTIKFTTRIPVDIQEEGSTTIHCDKFMSILSSLPSGDIEFIKQDIGVVIKPISKKIVFNLKSQASDNFPEIGTSENIPFFEYPSKDIKEMIKETIFAVSQESKRFFMTGVYFVKEEDNLIMVSTDGRRLSYINKSAFNVPDFTPAIIPTKILSCILKHAPDEGNIELAVIDKSIFVKFGNVEFSSNLLDGQFPNYRRVIPEGCSSSFMVNKSDFEAALKRTTIMVEKSVSRIIFRITPGMMKVYSPESDNGNAEEEIPCRYDGPNITMAFNINYVIDPLKVINSENVVFEFSVNDNQDGEELTISKAIILRSEPAGDYIHVIMPMNY